MIAVNIEVSRPTASVTAKPLIGPEPNWNSRTAAISVVIFASIIVVNAREYPASTADIGVRPFRDSSRIRSNMRTFASTAIPIVSTIPAIPGSVSVACSIESTAAIRTMLRISATSAMKPNSRSHKDNDQYDCQHTGKLACGNRIRAQFSTDGALFEDRQRRGQRAGAQQQGKVLRRIDREIS